MDNFESETDVTEEPKISLRQSIHEALQQQNIEDDPITPSSVRKTPELENNEIEGIEDDSTRGEEPVSSGQAPPVERIPLVPPADMNKFEKEAFLNPSTDNSHILQQYMNRRAYETRTDYQRKMQEVEDLKRQTSSVYDVIKEYEQDYAKHGLSVGDVIL